MTKTKICANLVLALVLASVFTVAITTPMVNAQEPLHVGAWLDRLYYAHIPADSVAHDDELNGYHMRSFYIRPPEGFDVTNAIIEMTTIYPNTPEYFQGINYGPPTTDPDYPQFTVSGFDPYTYIWDWDGYPISETSVGLHTNFPKTFQPGFDFARLWNSDPITEPSVTRLLTLKFTASADFDFEFFNAHIAVQLLNTPEASPSIDEYSMSALPDATGGPWESDWYVDGEGHIGVNWHGDPSAGTLYTFSVLVTVENKLYPAPILYTPAVGVGANYNMPYPMGDDLGVAPSVTIEDDLDGDEIQETSVTYAGTDGGDPLRWYYFTQQENSVSFPWVSAAPVWLEYNAGYWYTTTDDFVADEMLEGRRDGYTDLQCPQGGTGLTLKEPTLVFDVADGLEVESWSMGWWVEGPAFQWAFPDREAGQGAGASVAIMGPYTFEPGFEVNRMCNPAIITFPGGEQDFTFTFTPTDPSLNGVHFHINVPESEAFDARIVSLTPVPDNVQLSEDQRHLSMWMNLFESDLLQPHTFTVTIQITVRTSLFAIRFVPQLHVDARTYDPDQVTVGSSLSSSTMEIGTWTWSASGEYLWQWHESHARNVVLEGYWEAIPYLTVKLSGEFDYIEKEEVKIKLAALLTDAISGAAVSDADVTVSIYNDGGMPLVTGDVMVETLAGTGIYEWQSADTIKKLEKDGFTKGIYLVHVQASHQGGPMASDILEFHIDPPGDDVTFPTVPLIALLALSVSLANTWILWKPSITRRFRRAAVTSD